MQPIIQFSTNLTNKIFDQKYLSFIIWGKISSYFVNHLNWIWICSERGGWWGGKGRGGGGGGGALFDRSIDL